MCAAPCVIPSMAWAQPATSTDPAVTSAPPAASAPIDVPAPAEPPPASDPSAATTVETAPAPAPAEAPGSAPAAPGTISEDMLDAAPPTAATPAKPAAAPTPAAVPTTPATDEEEMESAAEIRSAARFHPTHDPGRFNLVARGLFANAGSGSLPGGRFGGVSVDLGQSWNRFGYAATVSAWGGRFGLSQSGTRQVNALVGIGPTVGLGRIAIIGHGFLDLRVGYDFFYGAMNRRSDTRVSANSVDVSPSKSVIPHGPRVRLDLGLMSHDASRRFFHGCGFSMGYQALVGSLKGPMPTTHMLTIGLVYWMG